MLVTQSSRAKQPRGHGSLTKDCHSFLRNPRVPDNYKAPQFVAEQCWLRYVKMRYKSINIKQFNKLWNNTQNTFYTGHRLNSQIMLGQCFLFCLLVQSIQRSTLTHRVRGAQRFRTVKCRQTQLLPGKTWCLSWLPRSRCHFLSGQPVAHRVPRDGN